MARFGGGKKSLRGKKKALYTRVKGRQNAKKKPILPGKGITQTSYETGFFDFLKVFWTNNREMEICDLTKQVANAWETLLPKPKLSKRKVLRDYSKEFKLLKEEAKKQSKEIEEEENRMMEKDKSEEETESGTEASSRSNFDDSEESIKSKEDLDEDRSRSDLDEKRSKTDDESFSESTGRSQEDSESELESDESTERRNRRVKRKHDGRRYESYEEYISARSKKSKSNGKNETGNGGKGEDENDSGEGSANSNKQEDMKDGNPKDAVFFPIREMTSFDKLVRADFDDQNEMLRKLKLYGSNTDPDVPDNDDTRGVQSVDSFSAPLGGPKLIPHSREPDPVTAKLSSPTDTLHVKNLVVGIRQPELQEIFRVFLNDVVLIRVLDNKYNGEAVVEFKSVEAAENVWRQMNGVEYKRLPLVLEFANKEDLLY